MSEPTGARRYGVGGGDAYYDAVRYGGYEGTREQFGKDQAEFAKNASAVAEAKETVERDTEEVRNTKNAFENTTVPEAIRALNQEGEDQILAITQKGEEVSQQVETVGTEQKDAVANEGRARVKAVQDEGDTQVQRVIDAGDEQVGRVERVIDPYVQQAKQAKNSAEAAQRKSEEAQGKSETAASNAEQSAQHAQELVDTLPDDYEDMLEDVSGLNETKDIRIVSGDIVSFDSSYADMPLKKMMVDIEPVQDLHGYDHPWPAGGGKNLLQNNMQSATVSGLTVTVKKDGSIVANGTPSVGVSRGLRGTSGGSPLFYLEAGQTYTVSGCNIQLNGSIAKAGMEIPVTFTANDGDYVSYVWMYFAGGVEFNKTYYPQLEKGSVVTSYEPYSNICPITGWTGAKVTRTGKNLSTIAEFTVPNDSAWHEVWTGNLTGMFTISIEKSGVTSVTNPNQAICRIIVDGVERNLFYSTGYLTVTGTLTKIIVVGSNGYARVVGTLGIQIELGSTATDYEPSQGEIHDITFPSEAGTVYGGKLEINEDGSGVLTVDRFYLILTANNTWRLADTVFQTTALPLLKVQTNVSIEGMLCNKFKTATGNVNDNRTYYGADRKVAIRTAKSYASVTDFLNEVGEISYVLPLENAQNYQLTAQQITSLLGLNNIWADTGNVEVQYGAYISTIKNELGEKVPKLMIAPVEKTTTASKAYAVNEFLIIGDKLYIVTANIASGGTITIGTNVSETTIGAQITALLNA